MADSKRFYWLKLKKDFFERQEIQIIESMPNGKEYVLFYLKLLCKSIEYEGKLRCNEQIPYTEEMLAVVTKTDIETVRTAIETFKTFGLIEVKRDKSFFMKDANEMIGSETEWAEKKRKYRETQKGQSEDNQKTKSSQKKTMSDKSKSKSNIPSSPPIRGEEEDIYRQVKDYVPPINLHLGGLEDIVECNGLGDEGLPFH